MSPLEHLKDIGRATIELEHRRGGGRVYAAEVNRGIRVGVVVGLNESSIVLSAEDAQRLSAWLQEHAR